MNMEQQQFDAIALSPSSTSNRSVLNIPSKQPFAKAYHLWALGVGAVISGNFFGWQAGLGGGFLGLFICLIPTTILYVTLSFSIAEMSTALPSEGGAYIFTLHGMGPHYAFFAAISECLKVITTCAVVNVGIGMYCCELLNLDHDYTPIFWFLFYIVFVGVNIVGAKSSFSFQLFVTTLSVILLVVFYLAAIPESSIETYVVQKDWMLPDGFAGIVKSLSFSMWFYLGIEELPLAVDETINPEKNMPKGIIYSMISLFFLAIFTVFFNSTISPGAYQIYLSETPLLLGYETVFGKHLFTDIITWLLVIGPIASFFSFVFFMGNLLYILAKEGCLPSFLSIKDKKRNTPYVALIFGSGLGFFITFILHYIIGDARLSSALINIALLGALISYSFQFISYILLKHKQPQLNRPYKSWCGIPGAYLGLFIIFLIITSIIYESFLDWGNFISLVTAGLIYVCSGIFYLHKNRSRKTT